MKIKTPYLIISILAFFFLGFFTLILVKKTDHGELHKCVSMHKFITEDDNDNFVSLTDVVFFLDNDNVVMARVIGSITDASGAYYINRTLHLSQSLKNGRKTSNTIIAKEDVSIKDNAPDKLVYSTIYPAKPGVEFYLRVEHLKSGLVQISGPEQPLTICKLQD